MTPPVSQLDRPAQGKLGLYVDGLLNGGELPMFSRQLLQLLALPLDDPSAVWKLVELVGDDYALTCKVLRIANSYHYNRSDRPIENLTHALVVLGTGTVQNLASTLVCFQSTETRTPRLRELMIRSMISAQVAAVAADLGMGVDRELGYLAGMLQNLGEVLVAHRSPDRHTAIMQRVEAGCARDAAAMMEVSFTFDHLARVIGRHWKLSPGVCAVWEQSAKATDLTQLARFANEVARVMLLGADAHREAGVALLVMRYGPTLRVTAEVVSEVWGRALADVRSTFEALGVSIAPLGLPPVVLKQAS